MAECFLLYKVTNGGWCYHDICSLLLFPLWTGALVSSVCCLTSHILPHRDWSVQGITTNSLTWCSWPGWRRVVREIEIDFHVNEWNKEFDLLWDLVFVAVKSKVGICLFVCKRSILILYEDCKNELFPVLIICRTTFNSNGWRCWLMTSSWRNSGRSLALPPNVHQVWTLNRPLQGLD